MTNTNSDVSEAILEMRDLLRLLAGPAIAERDQKRRAEIQKIVGTSAPRAKSVLLMNGSRTQVNIRKETAIHKGELSALVKRLSEGGLLVGDIKHPRLAIVLPQTFVERMN
jgi:DNA-binding MarR family transcriptional regulator